MRTEPRTYILAEDARFLPRAEFPEAARRQLPGEETDYVLLRERSRASSAVVSESVRELLRAFEAPTSVARAVIAYCARHENLGEAPRLLEAIYPVIVDLTRAGHLRPSASATPIAAEALTFGDWEVIETYQRLDDSQVFQARRDGVVAVVKVGTDEAATMLLQERRVLERLPPGVGPTVVDAGAEPAPHLAIEWLAGAPLDVAAEELRATGDVAGLAALAQNVALAYGRVHAAGCIHGDVHPRNILVDGRLHVKLIDFALGRAGDTASNLPTYGGVGFYLAPEVALSLRKAGAWPEPTFTSETYSLCTVLFELFAGTGPQELSLEREEMLRHLAEGPRRSLSSVGVRAPEPIESALAKGLAKRPEDRFETASQLAAAMFPAPAAEPAPTSAGPHRPRSTSFVNSILADVVRRAHEDEPSVTAPTASLAYGAAGLSYFLYRLGRSRRRGDLIAAADLWVSNHADESPPAFTSEELGIRPETSGPISVLHSKGGVSFLRALLATVRFDHDEARAHVASFVHACGAPAAVDEFALGRAGVLVACLRLREALAPMGIHDDALGRLEQACVDSLTGVLAGPLDDGAGGGLGSGVAHGWAGVLFAMLRWSESYGLEVPEAARSKMGELIARGEPHGRGLRWPIRLSGPRTFMPTWCNGSAGMALVFALGAKLTGRTEYAEATARAAYNCLDNPASAAGLCCGVAGQSYAFLAAADVTGDRRWLARAERQVRGATDSPTLRWRPDSLWNGAPGLALLCEDLTAPSGDGFPLFESRE